MIEAEPHHVIAIGASAGGMEEINTFFDNTSLDGVSYVVVQHLSPDFKSRMVELVSRHSELFVEEAANGTEIKRNHIYFIPNDKFMTVRDGRLYLSGKESIKGPHLTINLFFNSLAACYGRKAIGIVLSGLGADGTEGVRAIKNAGGMVIARNPEAAEFGSMPASAIATGMVDFISEPQLMPGIIDDYIFRKAALQVGAQDDEQTMAAINNYIREKLPLDFSDYKLTTLLRRTRRRAAHSNFSTLAQYYQYLLVNPEEVVALAKDFLISVTSFFRDPEAFEFIQKNVLPDILSKLTPGEELKIWIAGCATGEEVYSIAILIAEQLSGEYLDMPVKIFATDLDSAALRHASKGVYPLNSVKHVSAERLKKYFLKENDNYKVSTSIRHMVIFAQHDLAKNPPYCNMHFISCRNLLIYMTPFLQKKIFSMLLFGLKMNGYLFLGTSENPMPIMQSLEIASKKWRVYKKVNGKQTISFDAFSLPESYNVKAGLPMREAMISGASGNSIAEAMNDALSGELNYLAVCIDENNRVLKSYGNTSKYLLQQNFNSNLAELLPERLGLAFKSISSEVFRTNTRAGINGIPVNTGSPAATADLSIIPLKAGQGSLRLFLVIFKEGAEAVSLWKENAVFDEKVYEDKYIVNLENEVKELKEKLNTAYERLDAHNANMQSFNEELISANEEMQSTNEEMQSVNEELHTINADYQFKNKQLLEVNDDLNNYFRSNVNGQLFVNAELLLMKFSPGAVKLVNLLESDIGRPISHISTNVKLENIIDDIKQVLEEGCVLTKEIEANSGQWYQVMTMPYVQQADNKRAGAIVTFTDITALKKAKLELDEKNESLLRINADLDHFVYTVSHDLLEPLGSIESSIALMNELNTANPELARFLEIINSSIKKFRSLIKEIGTIAKLESNMSEMEFVDMDEVLNNIEWSLESKIRSSGAVINRQFEVKEIFFSRKNLRSILYNMISNAIKFTRRNVPHIHIHTQRKGGNIILSVADNGIGIPMNSLGKIFSIYGRLNQDIEGNGVGLYLAKKMVHAAGGEMTVESEPGKGSKFIIYLKANS
jgi:two-component system CheB/CheR fusion protein